MKNQSIANYFKLGNNYFKNTIQVVKTTYCICIATHMEFLGCSKLHMIILYIRIIQKKGLHKLCKSGQNQILQPYHEYTYLTIYHGQITSPELLEK